MNCTCGKTAKYEMRSIQNTEYAFAVCKTHSADPDFDENFSKNVMGEKSN